MTVTVVQAGAAFADVISTLHGLCFEESWDEKAVRELLAMPGATALVVGKDEQTPEGFILFRIAADEAEIITIGVLETTRRRGLATLLLKNALEQAGRNGAVRLFLEVAEDNDAARSFYQQAGFTLVGKRNRYYAREDGRIDALVFSLEITSK